MRKCFILICLIINLVAYSQEEAFVEALSQNVFALDVQDNKLGGAGSDLLKKAVDNAQFVLIGEQHGLVEVQGFSVALFHEAVNSGFKYMAIETDPLAARQVQKMARDDDAIASDYFKDLPMSIPFFYSHEGMKMARDIYQASDGSIDFWGLDQVFMVEPRLTFTRLVEIAESEEAKSLASDYLSKAHKMFAEAMRTGNPSGILMMTMEKADFDALREAFDGNAEAIELINEIELSKQIYGHWFSGEFYKNNLVRSNLMKRLFNQYYKRAIEKGDVKPKVMFKFGANHCVRGLTSVHMFDLGNMVSELAAHNGTRSAHIRLTGARGMTFNALEGAQEYDAAAEWHDWINQGLQEHLSTSADYLLVDLRPLRNLRLKHADEEIKRLVFGWDFWVIIPESTAVTPFR